MGLEEPHRCSGKRCRECVPPPLTQEEMFLRGTDRVLSEQTERQPFFSVREFRKSQESIGTVDEVREVPEKINLDLVFTDNSVAYLGEDGTHGAYGIGVRLGHQFCDIAGCYGKRDDCKLK